MCPGGSRAAGQSICSPSIRRPFAAALRATPDGTRYLAPEIQLLYKARDLRPEDRSDFEHATRRLESVAVEWLRDCMSRLYPRHPWLRALVQNASPLE